MNGRPITTRTRFHGRSRPVPDSDTGRIGFWLLIAK